MNKKIVLLIAILVVSVGFLSGCTEEKKDNEPDILEGLEYKNYVLGFGFNPPADWNKSEGGNFVVLYFKEVDGVSNAIINVMYGFLEGKSLSQYIDDAHEVYSSDDEITNYSIILENDTTISGKNAYELVLTFNEMKTKQYIVEKNSEIIISIGYLTEIPNFDDYFTDFEKSVDSLIII